MCYSKREFKYIFTNSKMLFYINAFKFKFQTFRIESVDKKYT